MLHSKNDLSLKLFAWRSLISSGSSDMILSAEVALLTACGVPVADSPCRRVD